MDWKTAAEKHSEALRRLGVILLALAVLAERAGSCSRPLRCLVLWLLRPAQIAAHAFAAEFGSIQSPMPQGDYSPLPVGDAARLAEDFRALAEAYLVLSSQLLGLAWITCLGRRLPGGLPIAAQPRRLVDAPRPCFADTS